MLSFYCAGAMYCAPTVSTFLTHPHTTKALFSFTAYKRPDFPVNAKQKVGAKIHAQKVGVFGEKTVTLHFGSVAASGSIGIGTQP